MMRSTMRPTPVTAMRLAPMLRALALAALLLALAALMLAPGAARAQGAAQDGSPEPLPTTPVITSGAAEASRPSVRRAGQDAFVINMRGLDIRSFAEQVAAITGRTLVLDPQLVGDVTVVSAEPLDLEGVWTLFQSVLRVRGFSAVPNGSIWQVVPEAEARAGATDGTGAGAQDVVTRLVPLLRLPSAEAMRVLAPLVAQSGNIEALTEPNAIIITDTRSNADRLATIARTFDNRDELQTQVVRLQFGDAAVIGSAIAQVLGPDGGGARISVDPASNQILVRGSFDAIRDVRNLAAAMDVAPKATAAIATRTEVFRLQFGDAEVIAALIAATLTGDVALTNPVAADLASDPAVEGQPVAFTSPRSEPVEVADVSVQASTELNAIVARGTEQQLAQVERLVQQLDERRPQVLIEAAIVEVSGEAAKQFGIQLGFNRDLTPGAIATTSFDNAGPSLQGVLSALGVPSAGLVGGGLTVGLNSRAGFGILVQALGRSTRANLLSTPSLTTLDNQPASIVVGQNVPFRTGSFATDGNTLAPFTTIERRDVGINMDVLPRITSHDVVRLDISQEISSLVQGTLAGAADLITNRRQIKTTVLADDGGTIVLGGLITEDELATEGKVPVAGDIPVIGNLFKSRNKQRTRRTLFIFLRPTILRNQHQVDYASANKYRALKEAEADRSEPRLGDAPLGRPALGREREVHALPLAIQGLY